MVNKILKTYIFRFIITVFAFSCFSAQLQCMLVNSKEIAENVKTAIIEAGTQVSSDFKDVIETTKPLWPNKDSCFTILGFLCSAAGLFFIFSGILTLINIIGRTNTALEILNEDAHSKMRAIAKIIIGIMACIIGIYIILNFGA